MKITTKRRAYLRSEGSKIKPICHIGKEGIGNGFIEDFKNAFNNQELVKVKVLGSTGENLHDLANKISVKTDTELVHIMGRTLLFFKENNKHNEISARLKEM